MTLTPDTAPRDRRGRAEAILEILERVHPDVEPFLEHTNAFQLLVAVILSAQCTDARVNLVTPALFARAPDAAAMAKLEVSQLLPYIRTCGLAPSKAERIIALSKLLVEQYGGEVPRELAALEELPGVGHKTACVVASQAFGMAVFPVDTHVHRLAGRWQLSRARNVEEVERDLKAVFPSEKWRTLHLQLILFGRTHCTAKQHAPATCLVCSWAMSKARANAELRQGLSKPVRKKKKKKKKTKTKRRRNRSAPASPPSGRARRSAEARHVRADCRRV
jgi:endonuclease-3